MKGKQIFGLIVFCALTLSCNTSDSLENNFGDGRIIPGKSIDGVELGDSRETVILKLGESSTSGGLTDGIYRAWYTDEYVKGPSAGLEVSYIELENQAGPADMIGVLSPYNGKTKEGIGIGSTFNDVRKIYGTPDHTYSKPAEQFVFDSYCFSGKHLEIHYKRDTVITMSIGYFYPLEKDTMNLCK